jgi:hypothetical protein
MVEFAAPPLQLQNHTQSHKTKQTNKNCLGLEGNPFHHRFRNINTFDSSIGTKDQRITLKQRHS